MKIAISSEAQDLNSQVDPRFGRCAYFIIVNTDDMSYEAFDNQNSALGGGAGIQSAQFVASKGAKVVLTGNIGPNAVKTLSAAGVAAVVGLSGTVGEAIDKYKLGKLKTTSEANVADHYGMGASPTQNGSGKGIGRGMGRGMGMCRKKGGRKGLSSQGVSDQPANTGLSEGEELKYLNDQAASLNAQIKAIESRIKDFEKK